MWYNAKGFSKIGLCMWHESYVKTLGPWSTFDKFHIFVGTRDNLQVFNQK